MPTPPPSLPVPSSSTPSPAHRRSLRWNEPIAQFRAIPPKEEDYYTTFEALPFNASPEPQEADEPPVPFLRSGKAQPPTSTPEPAWLKHVLPASEGGSDINMDVDHISDNRDVSSSMHSPISEQNTITLLEIGDSTMSSTPSWSSPQGYYMNNPMDDDDTLQNMILFANLNPGFSALASQLSYLGLQPILQEPQPKHAMEVQEPDRQHSRSNTGMSPMPGQCGSEDQHTDDDVGVLGTVMLPAIQNEHLEPPSTLEQPRTPLATLWTNTPTSSPSPGPSTLPPSQCRDNNHTRTHSTHEIHPESQLRARPVHPSPPKATNRNVHTTKPSVLLRAPSPVPARSNTTTNGHAVTPSPSCLDSGSAVSPVSPQPHHQGHTNNNTETVLTGLGAYSEDAITQPPRPAGTTSDTPPPRTIGAVTPSHHPRPATSPQNAVASPSVQRAPAVHEYTYTPTHAHTHTTWVAEFAADDGDVEMEPPASESESEEGEIDEDVEDQVDQLIDDRPELEAGEINHGQVSAVLRSHIAEYLASQASVVGSSSAFERRQAERRERRRAVPGMGAIGRNTSPNRSQVTGTSPNRPGSGGARRPRARHVPSIAGHPQQPTITTFEPESALVHPKPIKQYYPLAIATVHTWRTELDHLKCLCLSPGVFKNPSQYQSELGSVLKQIQENEENPDLTIDMLIETKLLEVLKAFQHCNGGAGPGLKCFKPLVVGMCKRWRERIKTMEIQRGELATAAGAVNPTVHHFPGSLVPGIVTANLYPSMVV